MYEDRFFNLGHIDAIQKLKDFVSRGREAQEAYLFRPREFSKSGIILSWVVYKDIICNTIIKEGIKDSEDTISDNLTIGNLDYDSLEEVKSQWLDRVRAYLVDLKSSRYFSEEFSQMELEAFYLENRDKLEKIPRLRYSKSHPGCIDVLYCRKEANSVFEEVIKVTPEGFEFHDNLYMKINNLLTDLEEHYDNMEYKRYLVENFEYFNCENKNDIRYEWENLVGAYQVSSRRARMERDQTENEIETDFGYEDNTSVEIDRNKSDKNLNES